MNLYRSRNGTMIHTPDCRFAVNAVHWSWADDKSAYDVVRACEAFGIQTCIACKPLRTIGTAIRKLPKGTET